MQSPPTLGRPLATGRAGAAISGNWSGSPPRIAEELERSGAATTSAAQRTSAPSHAASATRRREAP
jgi:hypothetical protein